MTDDESGKRQRRLLVVDDDREVGLMLQRALGRRGFAVDATSSPDDALARAATTAYDAAIVDLVMPGLDGAHLVGELRAHIPGLPIALLTGYAHSPLLAGAERSGVKVFAKPVVIHELVDFLRAEIEPQR
jgi:two-component system C4-dicarboxylate transport response regulator DctD